MLRTWQTSYTPFSVTNQHTNQTFDCIKCPSTSLGWLRRSNFVILRNITLHYMKEHYGQCVKLAHWPIMCRVGHKTLHSLTFWCAVKKLLAHAKHVYFISVERQAYRIVAVNIMRLLCVVTDADVSICTDKTDVEQCNSAESAHHSFTLPCVSAAAATASVLHDDWPQCCWWWGCWTAWWVLTL